MADTTFDIVIRFAGGPRYQHVFDAAAARWEQIIVADLPDVTDSQFGYVDDILIDATVVSIDGLFGVLGRAGPDWIRDNSGLPFHGSMEFDSADLAWMFAEGILDEVILHEMGHVFGIGGMWDFYGLRDGFGYTGANALAQYRIISGNASATHVPVQNGGGHWDEAIFTTELMTPFAEPPGVTAAISSVTVGSLMDMGYTVNMAAADPFSLPSGTPAPATVASTDFDSDGDSDILWRHTSGSTMMWEIESAGLVASHDLPDISINWRIVDADNDFHGDGMSDILWQDDTGAVVLWTMDGPNILSNALIAGTGAFGPVPDHWHIQDTGDFTGDGRADILWRDDAGRVVLWEMGGATIVSNTLVADVPTTSQIQDTADFTGDGMTDILWRDADGTIRVWEMDGATVVSHTTVATLPDHWQFAATGDFNGDARFDILWRDTAGTVVMWEMDGASIIGNTGLGTIPTRWTVVNSGDYNGDSNADILWRDNSGTLVLWELDGPTILANSSIGTVPTNWHIV
jgi:hypothetical protein